MPHKIFSIFLIYLLFVSCTGQNNTAIKHQYTNDLIHETSPYLLQHAHNPVNWKPWNPETLALAQKENKPIIISVGYAACHWCHVMEHESFEDEEVAKLMNENFINIKVDREERPDVDQVYMNAVQLMTGRGGWPMNVITLPDGRPFWGGTYFTKDEWMRALQKLIKVYQESPEKLQTYAKQLADGMKDIDAVIPNTNPQTFDKTIVAKSVANWEKAFDYKKGGAKQAPKFMMPNNYEFLLRYAFQTNNEKLMQYVDNTLTKMAYGGIYDHVGGGFSRYSVDEKWHVPHFEKMLYDNAQMVSLYADAYALTKNELYKKTIIETLTFVERELKSPKEGAFYSSLDADSLDENKHLEEGAFYVWTKKELQELLSKEAYALCEAYYNINDFGFWEKENYVLIRAESDEEILEKFNLSQEALANQLASIKKTLFDARAKRNRPRLDDKTLTSWNALMLRGYVDAYKVLKDEHYLAVAIENANFIVSKQFKNDGGLYHNYKDGKSTINGYLEDYSATIDAFLALYEVTTDEKWLTISNDLTKYCFDHFFDENKGMFYFTSDEDEALVVRSTEKSDNVIPASNSMMAENLFTLSHHFGNTHYLETAKTMLHHVTTDFENYGAGYSNWLNLFLNYSGTYYEVAIVGENAKTLAAEFNSMYLPNVLVTASTTDSDLHLLKYRYQEGETLIYVCINNTCQLPVTTVAAAKKFISTTL